MPLLQHHPYITAMCHRRYMMISPATTKMRQPIYPHCHLSHYHSFIIFITVHHHHHHHHLQVTIPWIVVLVAVAMLPISRSRSSTRASIKEILRSMILHAVIMIVPISAEMHTAVRKRDMMIAITVHSNIHNNRFTVRVMIVPILNIFQSTISITSITSMFYSKHHQPCLPVPLPPPPHAHNIAIITNNMYCHPLIDTISIPYGTQSMGITSLRMQPVLQCNNSRHHRTPINNNNTITRPPQGPLPL